MMKLALCLFATSSALLAQTAPPAAAPKPAPHKAATATTAAKPASTIPKVAGLPKTLYSLKYIDIKLGTGPLAEPRKFYTVNYTGWFPDGKKFDSSFDHAPQEPFVFPYGAQRVIIGWDTGFEGMRVGGKRRLFVPYQLAYGIVGRPPVMPPKANLIFDVELISFSDKPPAPKTPPAPPAAPPAPKPVDAPVAPVAPGAPAAPPAPGSAPAPTAPAAPTAPSAPTAPAKPEAPPAK